MRWLKNRFVNCLKNPDGVSLIELLVATTLFAIVMAAVTGMIIMSMRAQGEVTADFSSQLDARQALYDIEKNVAEAKRSDSSGNQPVFNADALAIPNQQGEWLTYEYATVPGESGPSILRIKTSTKPTYLPIPPETGDKQMIVLDDGDLATTVERVSEGAPVFTYYDDAGVQITAPVTNPRDVRSIKVTVKITVSDGHSQRETTVSSTQINLRNF